MGLPQKPGWIVVATALWLLALPVGVAVYTYLDDLPRQRSYFGWQGTAMLAFAVSAMLAGPAAIIVASCARNYNPKARLMAWRRDRIWTSILATAFFVPLALGCLLFAAGTAGDGLGGTLVAVWFAGCAVWALVMRALIVDLPS